jgi:hypothetical protein
MKKIIIILVAALASLNMAAREAPSNGNRVKSGSLGEKVMAGCNAPRGSKELWVNNVRTIIYTGGDMWWDLFGNQSAYYFIPATTNKATGVSSSFGGSIWLGGLDDAGQLKIAAMTYRQNGIDFWPGPLDTVTKDISVAECNRYDLIYSVSRADVDNFVSNGVITPDIENWPGNGIVASNQSLRLAPFVDKNSDGFYSPRTDGDYPAYDVENKAEKDNLGFCRTKLYGDYTLFWVFNDRGNVHTETGGTSIGVEVRAQAFGFKTNDEINNMTFYSYEVFNRSSFKLNSTYFSIWNDTDLGYYLDDYVGCDVKRGLGYTYNADPFDETISGANGYGDYPPAFGCDFFKGPLADHNPGDNKDNDQDGVVDEPGETIQMSRFIYYNNNYGAFPYQTTNPEGSNPIQFYNYMTGFWKDGSPFTFGGNAYGGTAPATFVYDGDPVKGTGWTERGSGNLPGDRRYIQSAGPFTLYPGAVNEITFGLPWAQSPAKGGYISSLELLYQADDKAQALFDNCFKILDGPEAPTMTIQEMNNELIIYLTNEKGKSNNYRQFNNDYAEMDISILSDPTSDNPKLSKPDKFYRFEGYKVYQVKNSGVNATDLDDPTKAVLVFQCDIKNGVGRLKNYEQDNVLGAVVAKDKVIGADEGIKTTFRVSEDAFSTLENRKLVNNKTYYFVAVAYAYNNYLTYAQDVPASVNPEANLLGQKKPYLQGRKFKRAAGIPHIPDVEKEGTIMQSAYGFGPKITRVEGQGNGGNLLTMVRSSEDEIVRNFFKADVTYENAHGPLNIKVVDPLNIRNSDFSFRFINQSSTHMEPVQAMNAMVPTKTGNVSGFLGTIAAVNINTTSWEIKDLKTGYAYYPNTVSGANGDTIFQTIKVGSEFYFPDLGFSVNVKQVADPGQDSLNKFTNLVTALTEDYTGPQPGSFIGASMSYENGQSNWLDPVKDVDGYFPLNWILSGTNKSEGNEDAFYNKTNTTPKNVKAFYDPQKQFAKILDGTWAPYPLCASYYSISPSGSSNPARIFCGPGFSGEAWTKDPYFQENGLSTTSVISTPNEGNTDLRKLNSALIVYTRDKSKWTRCPVLEMQEKARLSENHAIFFSPRKHASVDKEGRSDTTKKVASTNPNDPNFISANGMGWFPGYAISIETGERLNMAFGEDSYQKENNGDDMLWNPTSAVHAPYPFAFGGKHFVYVFGGNSIQSVYKDSTTGSASPPKWDVKYDGMPYGVGRYDYAKKIMNILNLYFTTEVYNDAMGGANLYPLNTIERDIMWVSIPLPRAGYNFKKQEDMPSDVRVQINVAKPYRYGWSGIANLPKGEQASLNANKLVAVNHPSLLVNDSANISLNPKNNNFPMYTFSTNDIAAMYNQKDVAKTSLDLINVVPNPYYASSSYEQLNRIDSRVRITNLPSKCTIRIYTMNGVLVRTFTRDVTSQEDLFVTNTGGNDIRQSKRTPYLDWDLKNQNNIMVASGLYLFHIDAPGIGEKVVKWFGVMRPLDVQSY